MSVRGLLAQHTSVSAAERRPASKVEKNIEMNTLASLLGVFKMFNFRSNGDKECVCAMMRVLPRYSCHSKALKFPLPGRSDHAVLAGNPNPTRGAPMSTNPAATIDTIRIFLSIVGSSKVWTLSIWALEGVTTIFSLA